MSMTPHDIQTQQFHVKFRGFDPAEVDSFLDLVAEDFQGLLEENGQLKDEIVSLNNTLKDYQSQEKTFQRAIVSAQKIAEEMKSRSLQEAEEMITKSRNEANQFVERAREVARSLEEQCRQTIAKLQEEIDRLTRMKMEIRDELKGMLQAYLDRVDQVYAGEAPVSEAPSQEKTPPRQEVRAAVVQKEDDLDDLYEKVDLPSGAVGFMEEQETARDDRTEDGPAPIYDVEDIGARDDLAVEREPPLDDDIGEEFLFSLEEPLGSDQEPAVNSRDEGPKIFRR